MENINLLEVNNAEIEAVSTNYVYPKGTYALTLKEVKQVDGETMSRIVFEYLIEDVMDVEPTVDVSKIVGKKMVHSISIFSKTQEEIKESLGKVKFAILNSGADKEKKDGSLNDLIQTAIEKTTMHKIFTSVGKDGVTRNGIDWTEFKPKAA